MSFYNKRHLHHNQPFSPLVQHLLTDKQTQADGDSLDISDCIIKIYNASQKITLIYNLNKREEYQKGIQERRDQGNMDRSH